MGGRHWTDKEVKILNGKYSKHGTNIPELDRTQSAIEHKAFRLGLSYDRHNYIEMTDQLHEYLNGLLLGDGCIYNCKGNGGAYYIHGDSSEKYLVWLKKKMESMGLPCTNVYKSGPAFHLRSRVIKELEILHHKWYPSGSKKILSNLEVSPTILKNWFIGDGTYYKSSTNNNFILRIYCKFDPIGKEKIADQINWNTPITVRNNKGVIYVPVDFHENFFKYILRDSNEIPPGYRYKFPKKYV